MSPHCSRDVMRTIRGIEKPPFLSLWAGAQDPELPARRPRRATGRAPDWPLVGRHPEPRAAQPAGATASLLLKPSCPCRGRIREQYMLQVCVALHGLLMFPFSVHHRGTVGAQRKHTLLLPPGKHTVEPCERTHSEGQQVVWRNFQEGGRVRPVVTTPFTGAFEKELVRNGKKTPSLHKVHSNPEG